MTLKWCYGCDKEKLLREFHGPKEHKNALCISCFDKATKQEFKSLGFGGLDDNNG